MKTTIALISLCGLLPPAHAATLTNSWTFESPNAFNDKTGTAHGTAGANITTTTGVGGGTAMVAPSTVAGSASYVDISETGITSMLNTGFSVTFWTKVANDSSATINRGFFDFSGNGGDTGIQGLLRGTDNALNFRVDGSGTPNAVIAYTTINIEDGQWHHIGLTFERNLADGFKLYVDGAFASSASTTTFLTTTTVGPNTASYLGSFNFTGSSEAKGLNGALDHFKIWSGAMTSGEVLTEFNAVPETSTAALGALAGLVLLRRRR